MGQNYFSGYHVLVLTAGLVNYVLVQDNYVLVQLSTVIDQVTTIMLMLYLMT